MEASSGHDGRGIHGVTFTEIGLSQAGLPRGIRW